MFDLNQILLSRAGLAESVAGRASRPHVDVYFSNPDLLWANAFHLPRFGQGAFSVALEAVYREARPGSSLSWVSWALVGQFLDSRRDRCEQVSGGGLPKKHMFGKPNPPQYRWAERVLLRQYERLYGEPAQQGTPAQHELERTGPAIEAHGRDLPFGAIYMIGGWSSPRHCQINRHFLPTVGRCITGDNPSADILGALNAGEPWRGALVRTGVYREGPTAAQQLVGKRPHIVVDDVLAAVQAALHRSRSQLWHAFR